jgi:hypothetical protein
MATIQLKYGTWNAGSLTLSDSCEFDALQFIHNETNNKVSGFDLRESKYENLLSKRNYWDMKISADELTCNTSLDFLVSFWHAIEKRLSEDNWLTCYSVATDGGDFPKELIDNNKYFPEVTFKLIEKEPS